MSRSSRSTGVETPSRERLHGLLGALLDDGLDVELLVTGASMSPFIRSGDLVTLVPRRSRTIRHGDVVAFLTGRRTLVIHRVHTVAGRTLRCRGDATRHDDAPVAVDDVVGLASRIERRGRPMRLGLGPERFLIAWLAARDWLVPLMRSARWLLRPVR